jgi:hypothetical protein
LGLIPLFGCSSADKGADSPASAPEKTIIVKGVSIVGAKVLEERELLEAIATRPSAEVLTVVVDSERYSEHTVQ